MDRIIVAGLIVCGGCWYWTKDDLKPQPKRPGYERSVEKNSIPVSEIYSQGERNFREALAKDEILNFAYTQSSFARELQENYKDFLRSLAQGGGSSFSQKRNELLSKAWLEYFNLQLKQNPTFKLNDSKTYQGQNIYSGVLGRIFKIVNGMYSDNSLLHFLDCSMSPKKPTQKDVIRLRNVRIQSLKPWSFILRVEYHAAKDNSNPRIEGGLDWNRQGEFMCGG